MNLALRRSEPAGPEPDGASTGKVGTGATRRGPWLWGAAGAVGSCGLAVAGARIGAVPDSAHPSWWYSLASLRVSPAFAILYGSFTLLCVAWLGVGRRAIARRLTPKHAWALLVCWSAPLFAGPPLFSRDLYSYVSQGLLAHRGLDPYALGPTALGPSPLLTGVADVWRRTPAPYGPFFTDLTAVGAGASHSLILEILAVRGIEIAGVVLLAWFLPRLAAELGADGGVALWLGVLSPLALVSYVASGHNDAIMLGLLVAGLWSALRGYETAALVLCTLSAETKLTAGIAIAFLVMRRLRTCAGGQSERVVVVARSFLIVVATAAITTLASGLGWAWIGPQAVKVPQQLKELTTPLYAVSLLVYHGLQLVGAHVSVSTVVSAGEVAGAVAALGVVLYLLTKVGTVDVVRLIALALFAVVVLGPIVWPWYFLWGLTLLAVTTAQRSKVLVALSILAVLLVGPAGSPVLRGGLPGAWYALVAAVWIAAATWFCTGRRWVAVLVGKAQSCP